MSMMRLQQSRLLFEAFKRGRILRDDQEEKDEHASCQNPGKILHIGTTTYGRASAPIWKRRTICSADPATI